MAIYQYTSLSRGSRRDNRNITEASGSQRAVQHHQLEVKSEEEQKSVRETVRVTEGGKKS